MAPASRADRRPSRTNPPATMSAARARRRPGRPRVESLEDRRLMAVTFHEFQIAQTVGGGTGFVMHGLIDGPDEALYFAYDNSFGTPMGPNVGRITTAGSFQLFPLPSGSGPAGITNGPDGAVWSADQFQKQLDRTTPTGTVTTQDTNETPNAITKGPDGNLWYTEGHPFAFPFQSPFDKIGRMTPSGVVTDFPLPTPEAAATSDSETISPGPDGALWFTEPSNDKIGRITTAGVITEFNVPTPNAGPTSITEGADGSLWFTEHDKIGRITTAGVITEFALPAGAMPTSIASGPDFALWFTDAGNNALGRMTTAGVVTGETPIPGSQTVLNTPQTLVLGPDNNLWLTLGNGVVVQAIPSLTPPTPTPTTTVVAATPSPATAGQPITLVALVTPQGAGTPTGDVTFAVDGTAEAPVALSVVNGLDVATLTLPSLGAGTHQVGAVYGGDASFATSMPAAPLALVVNAPVLTSTTTTLTASPNPAAVGQAITLTADVSIALTPFLARLAPVTPAGSVNFFIDGTVAGDVPIQFLGAGGSAQIVLPSLPAGTHRIVAMYAGDATFAASTSAPITETVGAVDGPRVTSLRRYGFHAQPTYLVLAFDGPLGPASAEDAADYLVVGPVSPRGKGGRVDPVIAALYDATNDTVTLRLRDRLNVHLRYDLTVIGTAPDGVSSPSGVFLDGAGTGHPGSNYETNFGREILAGPASAHGRGSQARRTVASRSPITHHAAWHRAVVSPSGRWHARA